MPEKSGREVYFLLGAAFLLQYHRNRHRRTHQAFSDGLAMYAILKCLGQAFLKHGPKEIASLVPFGGAVYEIARETWQLYAEQGKLSTLRGELETVAQVTGDQIAQAAANVVAEVAAGRPPEERRQLTLFLEQIPGSIRQSFRRASDPTGRTVPGGLRIDKPTDLLPLLPARLPRFHEGQKPLPGVDLVLVELLGVGGFGEVWKARNPHFDGLPPVALKFCLDPAAKDQLLHHEARVLNQVMREGKLDGIVALKAAYLSADPPCLEYEYVAGGDLASLIAKLKRQGKTDAAFAANIIRILARTVGFMHRLKPPIVHRDLKPANILVQQDKDKRLRFKITDFGIGAVAAERELVEHTRRPTNLGEGLTTGLRGAFTPLYASPQQQAGAAPDPRDDVHALGVIWYQLLTADLGLMAIPADWREVAEERGLKGEMLQLLGTCLSSKADRRPADAGVVAERIAAIVGGAPGGGDNRLGGGGSGGTNFDKEMKDAIEELRTKGDYRYYFEGQGPTRYATWKAAADSGNAIAQWFTARCLHQGAGVKKDAKAAVQLLHRAADAGLPVAKTDLGDCYYQGDGAKPDGDEAFRLYTDAAAQGFAEATVDLGDCYYDGKGVKQDLGEAVRYYRNGVEAGWARAQSSLGDCYLYGEGIAQDYAQAVNWYRKAADQGYPYGQFMLGYCYEHGRGVKADLAEAARLYRKAAEFDVDAQFALGYCYEHGRGIARDIDQAKHWYGRAGDEGHKRAANALARLKLPAGKAPKPEPSTEKGYWVIAPCAADHPRLQEIWEFDLAHNIISIGWESLDDISCLDELTLRAAIDRTETDASAGTKTMYYRMLWDFFHSINLGDVILARQGRKKLSAVGTVIRTAYYDPNKTIEEVGDWYTFAYHLGVRWDVSPRDKEYANQVFAMQTVYRIPEAKYRKLLSNDALGRPELDDSDEESDDGEPWRDPDSTNKLLTEIANVVAEEKRWCVAWQNDRVVNVLPADWLTWLPPLGSLYDDPRIWIVVKFLEVNENRVEQFLEMHGIRDVQIRNKLAEFLFAEAPKCGFGASRARKATNYTPVSARERVLEWQGAEPTSATIRMAVQNALADLQPKLQRLATVLEPLCKDWTVPNDSEKPIQARRLKSLQVLLQKGATSPETAVKFSKFRVEAKAAGGIMYGYDNLSDAGLIEWLKREDQSGWFLYITPAGCAALDAEVRMRLAILKACIALNAVDDNGLPAIEIMRYAQQHDGLTEEQAVRHINGGCEDESPPQLAYREIPGGTGYSQYAISLTDAGREYIKRHS